MKSILSLVCFALLQSGFLLPALAAQPDPQAQSPSAGSSAQESSGVQSEPLTQLDVAAVTQQLERLEADAKLPKANKEELKKLYETARASLEAAQLQRQRELSHKKEREDAPPAAAGAAASIAGEAAGARASRPEVAFARGSANASAAGP
jgi:hypothetical protein